MERVSRRRAFTIIELLVCVLVVVLLTALLIPALASTRITASQSKSLSNIRFLGTVITQYQSNSSDLYPRITPGTWYRTVDSLGFQFPFWQISTTWVAVVVDYMPRHHYRDFINSPRSIRDDTNVFDMTSYFYSWSFVCPPAYWVGAPALPASQWRGVRLGDVYFPSNKALLWDEDAGYWGRRRVRIDSDLACVVPVLLAEGSGHLRRPSDAMPAVQNPEVPFPQPQRLLATEKGVWGTDYR